MIFAIDSRLDLAVTLILLWGSIGGAVLLAASRSPSRPLVRSFAGGAALVVAAFVVTTSVGGDLEFRAALGASASALGAQWPSWLVAALLAVGGVWALRRQRNPPWRAPRRLGRGEAIRLAAGVLVVGAAVVFALPVWDVHDDGFGTGYHGHTYAGRGFHFH